uniref:Ig-like domain-containing protein n=1 Tax=Amphiprion ocellaris TaxID=80972 RepID=A0AAQ6ALC0_AMPOC
MFQTSCKLCFLTFFVSSSLINPRFCLSGVTAITVKENDDVILDCSFGSTNIEKKAFAWKKDVDQSNEEVFWYSGGDTDPGPEFKGRVSHFPDQLRFGNASIKITKAKTSDSGTYTCYHASVQKEIKSTISLTVGEFFHETLIKLAPEKALQSYHIMLINPIY